MGPCSRRLLIALLILIGCFLPLSLRAVLAAEPTDLPPPMTRLEASAFVPADLVVLGAVLQVTDVRTPGGGRGQQLVRFDVESVLKGDLPPSVPAPGSGTGPSEISVMVLGQRPTLNPDQPSVPYFASDSKDRYVLFLARESGQYAYRLQTLFETRGATGGEKIAVSQAVGRLAAIPVAEEKARRTLEALIAMTKGSGKWTKAFAAREMNYLAAVRPDVFDARSRARLQRLPPMTLTPDQRFWFQRLFKTLEICATLPGAGDAKGPVAAEDDPWRAMFVGASDPEQQQAQLTRLLSGEAGLRDRQVQWAWHEMDPSLRRWYARAVGEARLPAEARRLREFYAAEEEAEVRAAILRTIGLAGTSEDIEWLSRRAVNLQLRRDVLLAIARIHAPEGTTFLQEQLAAAERAQTKEDALWLAYLLGPDFDAAERRAGRR